MSVIKEFNCDKLIVRVFATREEMGACAGKEIAACMKTMLAERDHINVMFAAAPSQNETLAELCADPDVDWTRVNAFHMDEYIGLSPNHSASFRNYLKRTLFDKKPFKSVNLIIGDADDPAQEAERYERMLRENPIDICILGVGENGHIAFNDPPVADFSDPNYVKIVELDSVCRNQQVNDGCFDKVEDVPTHALTVTIPGMTKAKYMFCSVPAATKAAAIKTMIEQPVSEKCPASILRTHENAWLYTDIQSGAYLL